MPVARKPSTQMAAGGENADGRVAGPATDRPFGSLRHLGRVPATHGCRTRHDLSQMLVLDNARARRH